jgi:putative transcriptional regulator
MIRCHLAALMAPRNLNISDVSRQTGLNRSTVAALYHGRAARVELDAIDRLCRLFGCALGDLLEYVPEQPSKPAGARRA